LFFFYYEELVSKKLLEKGKINPADVIGLGTDFTSCTLLPVDEYGIPLCLNEQFRDIPNAWPKLWKHHGAKIYAEEIEKYAKDLEKITLEQFNINTAFEEQMDLFYWICYGGLLYDSRSQEMLNYNTEIAKSDNSQFDRFTSTKVK